MLPQEPHIILDEKREVLGSVIRITLAVAHSQQEQAKSAINKAFEECQRLDREYSRFRQNNQLSALNIAIEVWQEVSEELFFLLQQGEVLFQKTNGAFNLGVKSLLERWGYDSQYTFTPSLQKEHSNAISFKHPPYELKAPRSVKIFYPIELGGLGKGYALDLMFNVLKDFPSFCLDAGGDLYAQGFPEKEKTWEIFFENPEDLSSAIGRVEVDRFFLAASNPMKRKWAKNYHHLADPRSERPADKMLAVYTQAQSGLLADAYSTALFVLGFEEAKRLLPAFPIEAMLISPQREIYKTPGFKGKLFLF